MNFLLTEFHKLEIQILFVIHFYMQMYKTLVYLIEIGKIVICNFLHVKGKITYDQIVF